MARPSVVTREDAHADQPWFPQTARVKPRPGRQGRKPPERNPAGQLITIPFSILGRKDRPKHHILGTFSPSSWRSAVRPPSSLCRKTGKEPGPRQHPWEPRGALRRAGPPGSPQEREILSGGMNPVSPRVLSATRPSGRTTRWVMLPLLSDRRSQPSGGNCSARHTI